MCGGAKGPGNPASVDPDCRFLDLEYAAFVMPLARVILWVSSVGALALTLKAMVVGPPPLAWVLSFFLGYVALVVLGVVFPEWEMYGKVLSRVETECAKLALTFDDGPDPVTTPRILACLARTEHRATFFVIGRKAERHPELVQAILAQGHELALHGYQHSRLTAFRSPRWIRDDLLRVRALLLEQHGVDVRWFRPPINHLTPRLVRLARELGLEIVGCSTRALDGLAGARSAKVLARLARGAVSGAILGMHDAAEHGRHEPASLHLLPELLTLLDQRGLRSVCLSELVPGAR
jgi:peptidoglycan-N-acetylglucosamine deacetylase